MEAFFLPFLTALNFDETVVFFIVSAITQLTPNKLSIKPHRIWLFFFHSVARDAL